MVSKTFFIDTTLAESVISSAREEKTLPKSKKDMKKITTLLTVMVIIMLGISSCSDGESMKKLDGKWTTTMTESQAGEKLDMDMTLTLDAEAGTGNFDVKVSTTSLPDFFSFKVPVKKWSATSDKLSMTLDKENIQMVFGDAFRQMASMSGANLKDLEEEMKKEMKSEIDGFGESTIKSIGENDFILTEDGSEIKFTRVK